MNNNISPGGRASVKMDLVSERYSALKQYSRKALVWAVTAVVSVGLYPQETLSQIGSIAGEILHAETSAPIEGVEVNVDQAPEFRTLSGDDGQFAITGITEGNYTIRVDHPGFQARDAVVSVVSGELAEQTLELRQEEETNVTANVPGQVAGPEGQRASGATTSAVSFEQIDRFGEYTVKTALRRLPGVQSSRRGAFNIRGTGLNRYNATVDGQRMPTNGMGDRSVDLGTFSGDMVSELEVIKVVTPDMDADALGGVVNLNTRQPAVDERQINVLVEGGSNTQYFDHTGLNSRVGVRYSERPAEDLALSINLNHHSEDFAWESLGVTYGAPEIDGNHVDVIESISPGFHADRRNRLGGSLHLTYEPGEETTYHVRGVLSTDSRQHVNQRNILSANGDWVDQTTTGTQGSFHNDLQLQEADYQQYMVQAGGQHGFDVVNLEYGFGWAQSQIRSDQYRFPFQDDGFSYNVNMTDRTRPTMDFEEQAPGAQDMGLGAIDYIVDEHIDNQLTGTLDLEIPYSLGSVDIGASALDRTKDAIEDGAYGEYLYSPSGLSLNQFDRKSPSAADIFDDSYRLPWLLDADAARAYFHSSIPNIGYDQAMFHRTSDIRNYKASEQIYSGYGMASAEFGMFVLKAGARMEFTEAEYDSRSVTFGRFGNHNATTGVSATNSYSNLFPHAQVSAQPDEQSRVQLAYSRTMKRPDFHHLAPFEMINAQDTTITRGNPELEPLISDNLDLHIERYFEDAGMVALGVFYKDLSNFARQVEQTIDVAEGDIPFLDEQHFSGEETSIPVRETTIINSDETATLYGVEASVQHDLRYLPGVLSNLGLYANYTWTQSTYDPEDRGEVELPYQSPHVMNVAVDYTQGRFSTQISYHRTAEYLSHFSGSTTRAPSVSGSEEVYPDQFEDGWSDLSASLRFRISENFRFRANAFNLLDEQRLQYSHSRDDYPTGIDYRGGIGFKLGLQFNL